MARANFVKKAMKDIPGTNIKKGDSYYWWKFRYGGKHYSKEAPKPSQLINSPFLSTITAICERLQEVSLTDPEDIENLKDEYKDEIQTLLDETQEKYDNMPDSLQSGPTGEMLTNRVDSLQQMIDALDDIDENFYEDRPEEDDIYEGDFQYEGDFDEDDDDYDEDYKDKLAKWKVLQLETARTEWEEKKDEWLDEKSGEFHDVSYDGE